MTSKLLWMLVGLLVGLSSSLFYVFISLNSVGGIGCANVTPEGEQRAFQKGFGSASFLPPVSGNSTRKNDRQGQTKIPFAVHLHKSGGTMLCIMARQNRERVAVGTNCNMKGDGPHTLGQMPSSVSLSCEERYERAKKAGLTFIAMERFLARGELDCPHLFTYILVIRDPVERAISHMDVHKSKTAATDKLYSYVPLLDSNFAQDNYFVRILIGEKGFSGEVPLGGVNKDHLNEAKDAIDKFDIIIRLSNSTEDAVQFESILGWKRLIPPQVNVRSSRNKYNGLLGVSSETLAAKLEISNEIDRQAYQYACARAQKLTESVT